MMMMMMKRSRRYPSEIITDADYADDQALLPYTYAQAESLLHRLDKGAREICFYLKPKETDFMSFKRERAISTFSGGGGGGSEICR